VRERGIEGRGRGRGEEAKAKKRQKTIMLKWIDEKIFIDFLN